MPKIIWQPKDIIALTGLIICGILMAMGKDQLIANLFAAIIIVYVGIDIALLRRRRGG